MIDFLQPPLHKHTVLVAQLHQYPHRVNEDSLKRLNPIRRFESCKAENNIQKNSSSLSGYLIEFLKITFTAGLKLCLILVAF